jgi:hypothetical protein
MREANPGTRSRPPSGWRPRSLFFIVGAAVLAPALALGALKGENLLLPPIPGWIQAYAAAGNGIKLVEFVPPGQNVDSWTQMATIEIFFGHGGMNPRTLEQKVVEGFRLNCEALHVSDLGSGTANSLPAARWVTYCSKVKQLGKGEITYFQAISGKEHFYLVQRSWRGTAFDIAKPLPIPETLLKEWEAYLDKVSVCDSRDPRRPCP